MKTKRFLNLFIAVVLCLSSFTAFAYDAEGVIQEDFEEIIVEAENVADDPAEELVAMPEDDDNGSVDYSGNVKEEIPNLTGAYIDEKRGALKVTDIKPEDYPGKLFDDGIYHLYDYQFFFRNLQENVAKRLLEYEENYADRIDIYYNDEIVTFDVEPIIENDRTLVPFRAIFETMGCAVYYSEEDGKQIVTARRANDNLLLTIGENKMYFNGEEIDLDVPAKIKDGRTLVPLRAISEAFECEVHWYGDTKTIDIYSPARAYVVYAEKLSETITDDEGNVLIEAVAYYPVIENPTSVRLHRLCNEEYPHIL